MAERGIRQFIDVGAGFPTQRATHEVAGAIAGDCRVCTPTTIRWW
jgi:hypothetical protein